MIGVVAEFKRILFRLRVRHGRAVSVYITPSFALIVGDHHGRLSHEQILVMDKALQPSTSLSDFLPSRFRLTDRVIYHMPLDDIK